MSKTTSPIEHTRPATDFETMQQEHIEQLKTELADKDRQLAEARAEIERKDKLIEQMLEALENIRDYPGHIDYTTGEVHSMQEIAIAALAAERGE